MRTLWQAPSIKRPVDACASYARPHSQPISWLNTFPFFDNASPTVTWSCRRSGRLTLPMRTSMFPYFLLDNSPSRETTSQLEVLYAATLAGMGVAGLPTFMAADALRDGRLVRVLPDWQGGSLQFYAAMPTRKHVPARTRAFVDFLVEAFGGNRDDPWLAAIQQ